jgi:hypothetical protein
MDPANVIQLAFAGTAVFIFGRLGLALARHVERRLSGTRSGDQQTDSRLRAVEDECTLLRQELSELQERHDFTERLLQQGHTRVRPSHPNSAEQRVVTPH